MTAEHPDTRLFVCLLITGFLLCAAAAVHSDLDGQYRPTCPACQLERNVVCISPTDVALAALPEPAPCFTIVEMRASKPPEQGWLRIPSSRSPPVRVSPVL